MAALLCWWTQGLQLQGSPSVPLRASFPHERRWVQALAERRHLKTPELCRVPWLTTGLLLSVEGASLVAKLCGLLCCFGTSLSPYTSSGHWMRRPCTPRQTAHTGQRGGGGTSCPGTRGRQAWAKGPGQVEHMWLWVAEALTGTWQELGQGIGMWAGSGCDQISALLWRWTSRREGWRVGKEVWISSAPPQCLSYPGVGSGELLGGHEARAGARELPMLPCSTQTLPGLAQVTCQVVVREDGGILGDVQCCQCPCHAYGPRTGTRGPWSTSSWVEERGLLGCAAFTQHPQLLLSLMPKLEEQANTLLKPVHLAWALAASLQCKCTATEPVAAESSDVTGSQSHSLVTSTGCRRLPWFSESLIFSQKIS